MSPRPRGARTRVWGVLIGIALVASTLGGSWAAKPGIGQLDTPYTEVVLSNPLREH